MKSKKYITLQKIKIMATIVIDINNICNASKIMEAIRLFKGVERVTLEKEIRFPHLDKSIKEFKTGKTTRSKSVSELMDKLNS